MIGPFLPVAELPNPPVPAVCVCMLCVCDSYLLPGGAFPSAHASTPALFTPALFAPAPAPASALYLQVELNEVVSNNTIAVSESRGLRNCSCILVLGVEQKPSSRRCCSVCSCFYPSCFSCPFCSFCSICSFRSFRSCFCSCFASASRS